MAMIETWIKQDLKHIVKVRYLDGNVFSLDNDANLIGVEVFDNGAPASLSGSVAANVIRADGATVAVAGSVSGNKAYVVLPQTAYAIPGTLAVVIKLTTSSVVTTLGAVVSNVYRSSTDTIVDPGTIIPSIEALIAAIDAAVASIPPDYSDLLTALSDQNVGSFHGGYVKYADGEIENGGGTYSYTDKISVMPGDVYQVVAAGSVNVLLIAAYESESAAAANISKSVRGTGSTETFEYTVPDGITHIRMTTSLISSSRLKLISHARGLKIQNVALLHDGYVKKSDGTINVGSGSYSYSDMIQVQEGERWHYDIAGSSNVLVIAGYGENTDTVARVNWSVMGRGDPIQGVYIVPAGVKYIRITSSNSYNAKVYKSNSAGIGNISGFFNEDRNLASGKPILFNKYVNGTTVADGQYFFSVTDIPVTAGVKYHLFCDGSYQTSSPPYDARFITAYDSNGDVVRVDPYVYREYTAPTGAVKVTVSYIYRVYKTDAPADIGFTGYYYFSQYPITERMGLYSSYPTMDSKAISDAEIFYEEIRKATINFTFDDGLSTDSKVVEIFDNHGARCGFALIGWVMQSYNLNWYRTLYNRGYSILCHSNNGDVMNDSTNYSEAELLEKMRDPLVELETAGMKVSGWVTPSSTLKTDYIPTLAKFYNYGFTKYLGTWDGTGTPYDDITNTGLQLKRVHVGGTTLANLKAAVDEAIENNGLLSFYGHSYELDDGGVLDPAKLEELLEYIREKEQKKLCHLYAPDEAMFYYFRPRHND